ncbi:UNVERIFIED_CONTAM: hypothetical protein HDU68_012591 [Siphonaria sp. JEL0065]|nr:hypothetical protein HDU68_012591 [Siphonaria sp. JEL0065]
MSICPFPPTNYNPFTANGHRTPGVEWILPSAVAADLGLAINMTAGPKPGYGCFQCPSSPIGIPMLANATANITRTASNLCPQGFFCPYLQPANPLTWPVYCPPSPTCMGTRLGTFAKCDTPQGYYEPMACPAGFYCPTYNEVKVCPEGSFCLSGSSSPTSCQFLSHCPTGSIVEKHPGTIIVVGLVDLAVFIIFLYFRIHELKSNQEPLTALIPYSLRKLQADVSERLFGKMTSARTAQTTLKTPATTTTTNSLVVIGAKNSAAAAISENISILTSGFKKGLEGHDDLRMNYKFKDLSLKLATGKDILKGVSGEIKSGRMTAIMGPSGAGKTTFMNVLMGKVSRTDGSLRINNIVAEMQTYRKIIGYVPQEDVMIPELTVKENLLYSARIRLPSSWTNKEVEEHIDSLLKALNLAQVANSRIGSTLERGISGGQRKRVNIGLELAAVPLSIFLDEPTSGLDSTAALDVVNIMSSISRLGLTIVAVIHQPRLEIFEAVDDVLMIAPGGLTAYIGPVDQVQEYFKALGFLFDERLNPADVLMDILSGRGELAEGVPVERQHVDSIVQHWIQYSQQKESIINESTSTVPTDGTTIKENSSNDSQQSNQDVQAIEAMSKISRLRGSSFVRQVLLSHNRSMVQQMRLIGAFVMEAFLGALAGYMMGMSSPEGEAYQGIFNAPFQAISGSQDSVFLGMIGMINGIAIALIAAPPGVKVFGEEMAIYYREAAAGHNKLAYFIGKNLSIVYRIALTSAHFTAVYYLMAHPPIYLGWQYAFMFLNFFGIYGMAMIISMFIRRENAPLMAVTVGMIFGVLCGFAPTILNASKQGYLFLLDIGMNRWAAEALFALWIERYLDVYDPEVPNSYFGYELEKTVRNLGYMIVIALAYRVVAFVLLVMLNRDKQK